MHRIFRIDRLVVHTSEIQHALDRIENRGFFAYQLKGIAVARNHENPETLVGGLVGQAGEYVIGLVVFAREVLDVHRVKGFAKQLGLTHELRRGLTAGSFVLGILFGSKRLS